jgi:hypothetical protein
MAKMDASDVLHTASFVTFVALPLLIVAIAVNCAVSPTTIRLLTAPMIFSDAAVPADGAMTEADAGEEEDEPHAAVRLAIRTAALVWMASRIRPPRRSGWSRTLRGRQLQSTCHSLTYEEETAETAKIAKKTCLSALRVLPGFFRALP